MQGRVCACFDRDLFVAGEQGLGQRALIRGELVVDGVLAPTQSETALLLDCEVALDRLDQVGDEVGPTLELHVDAAPALLHQIAAANQPIEHGHAPQQQDDEDREDNV